MTHHRTTIPATNGLEKISVNLDATSLASLEWCQHWVKVRHRLTPATAVIVRRALRHYARHLDSLDEDESRREYPQVNAAAQGVGTARRLTEARARIEGSPFRPMRLNEALHSPQELAEMKTTLEAIETRMSTFE